MTERADSVPSAAAATHRGSPLWELTKARLREFGREKGTIFWVFGFPLLMAIALGLAFRSTPPERPRVAVVLSPHWVAGSVQGRSARALLVSSRLQAESMSLEQAQRQLGRAKVDLVVDWDGEHPVYRFDPLQQRSALARALAADEQERALGREDRLRIAEVPVSEHGARYIDFLLPGLIGMNLMGSSMWGVGYSLVVARKRRLLRRYAVTPMRHSHFLLSYFLSRSFFLLIELAVLLLFGWLAFGVTVRGSQCPGRPRRVHGSGRVRRAGPADRCASREHRGRQRLDEFHSAAHVDPVRDLLLLREVPRVVAGASAALAPDRLE